MGKVVETFIMGMIRSCSYRNELYIVEYNYLEIASFAKSIGRLVFKMKLNIYCVINSRYIKYKVNKEGRLFKYNFNIRPFKKSQICILKHLNHKNSFKQLACNIKYSYCFRKLDISIKRKKIAIF